MIQKILIRRKVVETVLGAIPCLLWFAMTSSQYPSVWGSPGIQGSGTLFHKDAYLTRLDVLMFQIHT